MSINISEICRLIGLQLGIKKVGETDHLREDLGAESLDIQNIVMAMEDKYKISVTDEEMGDLMTVTDFHKVVAAKA